MDQKTTTVSITGTLRAEVEKKAGPLTAKGSAKVQGAVSHSITKAKIVTYESRQFLVIPPGFSFCAFTNNTSVDDVNAPTGFRWRCSFPEYIQAAERFSNGRCTSLEICEAGACALRDLSIFFGPRLWLEREYVVHVASLISYRSKSEVYYPDFSTLWHEKIWRLIRRRMALTFYIYLMFRKNGIINQFSDISYCETQKVKYTRNIHRRFLRFFFCLKSNVN